jgi:hypothetical protein
MRKGLSSPFGILFTKLSLGGNNFITYPARESLVSDILAGDGNVANIFFYGVVYSIVTSKPPNMASTETTILYVSWIFFVPGNVARSWSLLHIAQFIIVISVNINADDLNTIFVRAYRNKAKNQTKNLLILEN